MATIETVVDQRPVDLAPVDTSVTVPEHVRRAAAAAEAIHNQYYPKAAEPVAEAAPEPVAEAAPAPEPEQQHQPPPQHVDSVVSPTREELHEDSWAARYNSMKGRWEASQRTIGSMQEQMSQLGDELMRTQQLLRGQSVEPQQHTRSNVKLITEADEQAYGPELLDVVRRAAMESVSPELEQLREENNSLKQRVTTTAKGEVRNALSQAVPNWQVINKSPEFKNWLRLRNVYTGEVRQTMLNAAYEAADAPKVAAFFKDFLREGIATGQMAPALQQEQPVPVPRQAAVTLDSLAAPGRARPASGEFSNAPADKPILTRAQIATFYSNVRAQHYVGREAEKGRLENMIFEAQREGRVR